LNNLALFWVKNGNFFAKFFGKNILKIITLVPGHPVCMYVCQTESNRFPVGYVIKWVKGFQCSRWGSFPQNPF
jgi:hypothetical protein